MIPSELVGKWIYFIDLNGPGDNRPVRIDEVGAGHILCSFPNYGYQADNGLSQKFFRKIVALSAMERYTFVETSCPKGYEE